MTAVLSGLGSVHLCETGNELVIKVVTPADVDLTRISARLVEGVIEIRLPRARHHYVGINPEASGV